MASTKPPKGMRDFLPADVRKRNYVINIIKEVYESYGFEPLETPSVENLETLMGKYGDEGNQLVFKILKRGEKLRLETGEGGQELKESDLSDLALRYDLTVPLARVVANNKNDLPKFFKRYQIQPVWRADRPARGRFREFYQCDVDAIGSSSLICEAELISATSKILHRLGFRRFRVRLNHRQVLTGLLESVGVPKNKQTKTLVIFDKRDKLSDKEFIEEIKSLGLPLNKIGKLLDFMIGYASSRVTGLKKAKETVEELKSATQDGSKLAEIHIHKIEQIFDPLEANRGYLERVDGFVTSSESGKRGVADLTNLLSKIPTMVGRDVVIDPTLARGLSYYTGTIMEIDVSDFPGSLGGGGRYDGLIGMFGKEQIPACGFSLGLERILVVMEERGMFPPEIADSTPADVLVTIESEDTIANSLILANVLRGQGLRVTVYPQPDKEDKQWKYANSIEVPWICTVNQTDIDEGVVSFQNLRTREKYREPTDKVAATIKEWSA